MDLYKLELYLFLDSLVYGCLVLEVRSSHHSTTLEPKTIINICVCYCSLTYQGAAVGLRLSLLLLLMFSWDNNHNIDTWCKDMLIQQSCIFMFMLMQPVSLFMSMLSLFARGPKSAKILALECSTYTEWYILNINDF